MTGSAPIFTRTASPGAASRTVSNRAKRSRARTGRSATTCRASRTITPSPRRPGRDTLPIYEHGYNISKRHQLAIGARRVAWFDFPLWQGLSHEQLIIDQVGATADLVALAHPGLRDGYTEDNLRSLTGYQLLEVVNGPFDAEEPWDWALSSGHVVWGVANDDSHDTTDPRRTAMAWNMIDAPSTSTPDVVSALREGRAYAVGRTDDEAPTMDAVVTDVKFAAGTLTVTHDGPPSTLEFVGQNGAIRRTVKNALERQLHLSAAGHLRPHGDSRAQDHPLSQSGAALRRRRHAAADRGRR